MIRSICQYIDLFIIQKIDLFIIHYPMLVYHNIIQNTTYFFVMTLLSTRTHVLLQSQNRKYVLLIKNKKTKLN